MIADLVLSNAKVNVNNEILDCSLAIDSGKIVKIGKAEMPKADTKIDLKNLLVLPGLIDTHVHLRDERKAYKETFQSGTTAAAAGGMTTVLDMPNNDPVTMSPETLRGRMEQAEEKIVVNVGFYSEFPEDIQEMKEIVKQGAIAFKLFMTEQVGGLNIEDDPALLEAFKIASSLRIPVAVHAEDRDSLKEKEEELRSEDRNDVDAFLEAHSENIEAKAIKRLTSLAKQNRTHIHFCHVSSEKGLGAIIEAKRSAIPVTCEATPHHLFLTASDLRRLGTLAVTMPPVREEKHVAALWNAIRKGLVDTVGSDHAPHSIEEKKAKDVWSVKVGISGLETTLPLLLTGVNNRRLTIGDLTRLLSEKPAEIFGLRGKGCLKAGSDADLTVVDLKREYKIDASRFQSKAKYSPFDGWLVEGKPVKTFVGGQLVMDEGAIIAEAGCGKVIRRE